MGARLCEEEAQRKGLTKREKNTQCNDDLAVLAELWGTIAEEARPIKVAGEAVKDTPWGLANGCEGIDADSRGWISEFQPGQR